MEISTVNRRDGELTRKVCSVLIASQSLVKTFEGRLVTPSIEVMLPRSYTIVRFGLPNANQEGEVQLLRRPFRLRVEQDVVCRDVRARP